MNKISTAITKWSLVTRTTTNTTNICSANNAVIPSVH